MSDTPAACPWCGATEGYERTPDLAGTGPGLEYPVPAYRCLGCGKGTGYGPEVDGQPTVHRLTAIDPIIEF
jgi:hypothetical protein